MNDAAPKPCELSMCVLVPWQVRKIESIKLSARERDPSPCALLSIRREAGACTSHGGKAASYPSTARALPTLS